jgi:gamma-glutamylcyclotransferase (GGCT)/AIG2-like uncharacterized protein YtfP
METYLFAYGMFRDVARDLLGDLKKCERTTVNGKMYWVNSFYPGVILGGDDLVHGDIYLIDSNRLDALDEFEGEEYHRKKIITKSGKECWIYEYILPITGFKQITSGDWFTR